MKTTPTSLLALATIAVLAAALPASLRAEGAPRPNVLLIVSDDQGYNDLGALGNGIITPALDRLAAEGVRLTDFYVTWPACTPSRSGFLTGRYPQRNGTYDMIRNEAPDYGYRYPAPEYEVTFERIGGMDERELIIPQLLPEGYQSAIYGKWDLGTLRRFLPTSRGFDDFYGFVNTGIDYYTHERYGVPSMYRNLEPTEEDRGVYATHLFEREALRFLDEHAGNRPFFLYLPFNAPHSSSALEPEIRTTVQAPDEYKALYPPVAEELREVENFRYGGPARVTTPAARERDYRASVTCMDASIGRILDLLDERGVADDTIVIYFSDNGGGGGSDNTPLRGNKGTMWEGGIRVLCLVRWTAGGVPAGTVSDAFLSSLEILPSLLAATDYEPPEGLVLDGYDWWPALRGESPSPRDRHVWQRRDEIGVRVGDWKWVKHPRRQEAQRGGLFNLAEDIGESEDLSERHPEKLAELQAAYAEWVEAMEAAEPRGPFRDF